MSVKHDVGLEIGCRLVVVIVPVSWTHFGGKEIHQPSSALQVVQGKAMWIAYIHHILPTNSTQLSHQKAEEGTENKGNFISSKVRKMAKNGNGTKRKHAIVRDQTQFSDSESYKI